MTQELIERLRDRRGSIPIGCDKDGEVVFGDDHDALKAADALQSQSARIAELEGLLEPFANLADANMNDPLRKWLTVAHIQNAAASLTKDSTSGGSDAAR